MKYTKTKHFYTPATITFEMWTYLAYILDRYWESTGKTKISISELYNFHNKFLWMGEHLTFWEGLDDLKADVSYLEKTNLITVKDDIIYIVNLGGLSSVSRIVNDSGQVEKLYGIYKERIDRAMDEWLKV
ncbi:MAG: hypothetical protein ABSD73_12240 [Candidatus Bathyarchaeia archaeon]